MNFPGHYEIADTQQDGLVQNIKRQHTFIGISQYRAIKSQKPHTKSEMANNQLQALKNESRVFIQSLIQAGKTTRDGLNNWYRYTADKATPSKRDIQR